MPKAPTSRPATTRAPAKKRRKTTAAAVAVPQHWAWFGIGAGIGWPIICLGACLWILHTRNLPTPGPTPGPDPAPIVDPVPPGPAPTPAPVVSKLPKGTFLAIIEQTEDRSKYPYLATLQKQVTYWQSVRARGYPMAWLDVEQDAVTPYRDKATGAGLPAFLAISPTGDVLQAMPCPTDTKTFDQYLEPK